MKREIKFRAMDARVPEDAVHWVHGAYVQHLPYTPAPIGTPKVPDSDYEYAIVNDAFSDWQMPRDLQIIPVRPNMVGQYTGLNDKNGCDIYESDILKVIGGEDGESYVAAVKWFGDEDYPAFDLAGIPETWFYDANALATIVQGGVETCEVIGNIFENKDLMEGNQ